MIGVICSEGKERMTARQLYHIFRPILAGGNTRIIVFQISNLSFASKTVWGSLITDEGIYDRRVRIPSIIFNFSRQWKARNIKKLRYLVWLPEIRLINDVNSFDQWMIMELLASSADTVEYILPHSKAEINEYMDNLPENDCLVIPVKGAGLSGIKYIEKDNGSIPEKDESMKNPAYVARECSEAADREDRTVIAVPDLTARRNRIVIAVPKLITRNGKPLVARVYLQKSKDCKWMVIAKKILSKRILDDEVIGTRLNKASIMIMKHITKYIPSVGNCYIEFILDTKGDPYFLRFGGFDDELLSPGKGPFLYNNFRMNLLHQADCHRLTKKGD